MIKFKLLKKHQITLQQNLKLSNEEWPDPTKQLPVTYLKSLLHI
jgi:hypothetical protein